MKPANLPLPAILMLAAFTGAVGLAILHRSKPGEVVESPRAVKTPALETVAAALVKEGASSAADGVVEAVRQTVVSAQVAGTLVSLPVKAGDRVMAGQVLARVDARAAQQASQASEAQARSARASLDVATQTVNRQRQLRAKGFISAAALDQAEAEFKAAEAIYDAQVAQVAVSRTQSDFHVIRAPYGGVVSDVMVVEGDMAMPGRALLSIYDPSALRVTATLAQSDLPPTVDRRILESKIGIEVPGRIGIPLKATRALVLPAADPNTQTVRLRLDLAATAGAPVPGTFARILLPANGMTVWATSATTPRVRIPASAVVRRGELTGTYVLVDGQPRLRQVRLGAVVENEVDVLSGLNAGEPVVRDAQAAARSLPR